MEQSDEVPLNVSRKWRMDMSIRVKIVLFFLAVVIFSVVGLFILFFNQQEMYSKYVDELKNDILHQIEGNAEKINTYFSYSEKITLDLASSGEQFLRVNKKYNVSEEEIQNFLVTLVGRHPSISGGGIWFEPYAFSPDRKYYSVFSYWENGKVKTTLEYNLPEFDYQNQDWYLTGLPKNWDRSVKREKNIYWSAPYKDPVSDVSMFSFIGIMTGDDQKIIGVSTVDVSLQYLGDIVSKITPTPSSKSFSVDSEGHILAYPAEPKRVLGPVRDVAGLERVMDVAPGESRIFEVTENGREWLMFYSRSENGVGLGVSVPSDELLASARKMEKASIWVMAGLTSALLILSFIVFYMQERVVIRPLNRLAHAAAQVAAGRLDMRLTDFQRDEIGMVAKAIDDMTVSLKSMITEIRTDVERLTSSSESLAEISAQVSSGVTVAAERTGQVAVASENMSADQASVAAAMEEASINMNTVAAATEEMSATIGEIAANSSKAREITRHAVDQARSSSVRVHELGVAANEINKVTEAITAISSQTNLLALNATIEAARAGEAGRGFAVVANEIKELAQQTARSTEEIQSKIQDIQQATQLAVGEIDQISGIVTEVDGIVSTIAAAVEEQSVTTRDIAGNVGQASLGLTEVNTNVSRSSAAAREIAADVADISVKGNEILTSSEQVKLSAEDLADTAENLKVLVARFRLEA